MSYRDEIDYAEHAWWREEFKREREEAEREEAEREITAPDTHCEHGVSLTALDARSVAHRYHYQEGKWAPRETTMPRTLAWDRGYSDGLWATYRPNADDDRDEYDAGHAAGVAYRQGRMAR